MRMERGEDEKQPPSPSPWDCGSPLYDAFELASVYRVLDTHLMALPLPYARRAPPGRAGDATTALAERAAAAVAKAKAKAGRSRRRRAVAKAARRTGQAVLHSICRSVAACGGRGA